MSEGVAYLRVSSQRQEQGISLTTQRDAIRQYADAHGITIKHEFCDILSGTRDDRPRYTEMLSRVESGQTILVWRLDRIGRRKSELFRFFEHCKRHRVALVSVTQPEMSNELARDIMSVIAAYESQQIAERVLPNMAARVEQGKWVTKAPRWYKIGPDGTLVPTEDAADAQRVWDAVLRTGSVEAAAALFDLNTNTLRNTLKIRTYLGETVWNGIVVPGTHPAIVRRETWEAVAAMRAGRAAQKRRTRRDTALLTGFIYVGDTNERLYHYIRKRLAEGTNRYYVTKSGAHTRYHSIRAEDAERAVVDALRSLTLDRATAAEIEREMRARSRDDPHRRERATLRRKIAALDAERIETARMEARRRITPAEADRMRGDQERERASHAAALAALPGEWDAAAVDALRFRVRLAERVEAAHAAGNIAALRLFVEAFVSRVEVWGGETSRAYYRQPPREVRIVWQANVQTGPTSVS